MSSDNDTSHRRRPFQKLKRVINNLRTSRSRSPSPATLQSTISFTSGIIHHAHSIPESDGTPSKYLLLAVSHEGQLLDIPTHTTSNIGYITCQCKPHQQTTYHKKIIAFITSAHPPRLSKGEHCVDSPFVFPQLTPAQKSISKCYPLFFKLPQAYADNTSLIEEFSLELKSIALAKLKELTEHVYQNEINHVYTQLFATSQTGFQTDSHSQSSKDSEESEDPMDIPQSQSSSLFTRLSCSTCPIPKPGVLIYAHHKQVLKNFTRKELSEVFKSLPQSTQETVKHTLADAGHPIAGIYLNNNSNSDTTKLFAITLRDMHILRGNIFYKTVTRNTLTYTLALLSEIYTHVPSVTQIPKITNSRHFIEQYKALIMTSDTPGTPHLIDSSRHKHQATASHTHSQKKKAKQAKARRKHHIKTASSSSEAESISPERTKGTDSILQTQTYQPPILGESTCPQTYHTFWKMKAKTRRLPPSNTKLEKFVAPRFPLTMLQLTEQVNYPDLLSMEFVAYAQAYDSIVKQKNYSSVVTLPLYTVGVINAKQDLILTGQSRILNNLLRHAPPFPTKNLETLTEDTLTEFFAQVRTFMLTYSIPWYDFSSYFLTPAFLGANIYNKALNVLQAYPKIIQNFSCFIQRIILGLITIKKPSCRTIPPLVGHTSCQVLVPPNAFSRPPPDCFIRPPQNLITNPPPNYAQHSKPTQPPTITQGNQASLTTHASYPAHPTSFW